MSKVTNIVLMASFMTDETLNYFANNFLEKDTRKQILLPVKDCCTGGTKCLEAEVLVGAFNHINSSDIPEFVQKAPWPYDSDYVLLILDQDDDLIRINKGQV
jgi:hypothetical protein